MSVGRVQPSQDIHDHHDHHGYQAERADLQARLRRIEGQVRGLQRMVDDDRYCIDILTQLAAVKAALNQVGLTILANHTKSCVAAAVRSGDENAKIDELMQTIKRFIG